MAMCYIKTLSPSTLPTLPLCLWRVKSVLVVPLKGKPKALHSASITELQALGFGLNWEPPCVALMSLNSQEAGTSGAPAHLQLLAPPLYYPEAQRSTSVSQVTGTMDCDLCTIN